MVGRPCVCHRQPTPAEREYTSEERADGDYRGRNRAQCRNRSPGKAVSSDVGQSELLEGYRGEVERSGATGLFLAVDVIDVFALPSLDAAPRRLEHLIAIAEVERVGWALLDARGHSKRGGKLLRLGLRQLLAVALDWCDRMQPVDAQSALTDFRRERAPIRGDRPKWAGPHAVTAPDADVGVVDDRSLRVLAQRGHRTRGHAGRVVAVHALPLCEDAAEAARRVRVVDLMVSQQHVCVGGKAGRVLHAEEFLRQLRLFAVAIVPLLAAHLAGFAPDASRRV